MRMVKGISMGGGTMVTDGIMLAEAHVNGNGRFFVMDLDGWILDDRNGHGCRTKTAAHRGYCYKRRRGLA